MLAETVTIDPFQQVLNRFKERRLLAAANYQTRPVRFLTEADDEQANWLDKMNELHFATDVSAASKTVVYMRRQSTCELQLDKPRNERTIPESCLRSFAPARPTSICEERRIPVVIEKSLRGLRMPRGAIPKPQNGNRAGSYQLNNLNLTSYQFRNKAGL